jgi:predicted secreted Zn-dependent protease
MECYISRNTKKYQVIEKFKMGDPYCNDPRCQRNRNEERHKAHAISEKLANIYFSENYCNDPRCQGTGMERDTKHTMRESFQKKRQLKGFFDTTEVYPYCNDPRCQTNRGRRET